MQVAARGCPDVLTKEQVQPAPETRAAMQAVALPVPESHWNEQETGTCPAWQVAVMLSTPLAGMLYPVGTAITFINMINTLTIAITSDTMYLAGAGTTGSRTLAAYGVATAIKVTSTSWIISGVNLT